MWCVCWGGGGEKKKKHEGNKLQATEASLMPTKGRNLTVKRREIESQPEEVIGSNEDVLVCLAS